MKEEKRFNNSLSSIGWGALFIWWGVVIMIDPITLGMGAVGTGLILLALNAVRMLRGIPPLRGNTIFAIAAIAWGALYQVRIMLSMPEYLDYAFFFIVIGLVSMFAPLLPHQKHAEGS